MAKQPDPKPLHARHGDTVTVREQRQIILSICSEVLEVDSLNCMGDWFDHVGFDVTSLRDPSDLAAAWLGHYRHGRGYDMDRVFHDHMTWPPVAQRIAFLTKQKEEKSARAAKKTKARGSAARFGDSHA